MMSVICWDVLCGNGYMKWRCCVLHALKVTNGSWGDEGPH